MQDYSHITMSEEQYVPGLDNGLFRRYVEMLDRGGEKLLKEVQARAEKLQNREKPGKLCFGNCWIDDERCIGCAAAQEKVYNSIIEVQQLEKALADPELLQSSKKFDKCDLCGAPYEPGATACSYCGKPYPDNIVPVDLPKSTDELRRMIRRKAYEAWQGYPDIFQQQMDWLKKEADDADDLIMRVNLGMASNVARQSYAMSLEQLERGADLNAMSLSEYMLAVLYGKVESESAKVVFQQLSQQQDANQARRLERMQLEHEAKMKALDRQQEYWKRQAEIYRPPQYSGGSGGGGGGGGDWRTCVNCTYYSAGARRCAYKNQETNAGDSCGFYRSK